MKEQGKDNNIIKIKAPSVDFAKAYIRKKYGIDPENCEIKVVKRRFPIPFLVSPIVEIEIKCKRKKEEKREKNKYADLLNFYIDFKLEDENLYFKTSLPRSYILKNLEKRGFELSREEQKKIFSNFKENDWNLLLEKEKIEGLEPKDYEFEFEIIDNNVRVKGKYEFPKYWGKGLTVNEAIELLKASNIKEEYVIKENLCALLLGEEVKDDLIALGVEPIKGKDAYIEFLREVEGEDILDVDLLVEEDEVIAKKIPPTEGQDGINVFGEMIKAEAGNDFEIPELENIEFVENEFKAKKQGLLSVVEIDGFKFPKIGNIMILDEATENVEFFGDILVKQDVKKGVKLKATGIIEVRGVVEEATVESENRIVLKGGFSGGKEGFLQAKEVYINFVNDGNIYADELVYVKEYVRGSTIYTNDRFICNKGKGMVTGKVFAKHKAQAKIWGSDLQVKVEVEVGYDVEKKRRLAVLEQEVEELNKKLDKENEKFTQLTVRFNNGELEGEELQNYFDMKNAIKEMEEESEKLAEQISQVLEELEQEDEELLRKAQIIVEDIAYPGCIFKLRHEVYVVKNELKYTRLRLDGLTLKLEPY